MRVLPGPVRIVLLDDAGVFFDDLSPGAGTRHGRAQENVDHQHDEEEHSEGDAQPQQPRGVNPVAQSCN